jgi:cytochrome c-type biogenesis protein CcmF
MEVGRYSLGYVSLDERQSSNATEIRALLRIRRGDDDLGTLEAGKNAYTIEQQVSNEVGIRSDRLTGEDLFVIAEQIDPDGSVYFRVFVKPLVNLIWLAGLVFLVGSLVTLWPDRREQRRLVARASEVGIPATP